MIRLTEEELATIKIEWLERGKRQAEREMGDKIANALGLYEVFETRKEDD